AKPAQRLRSVEELEACFYVCDSAGQKLAYVYFENEPGRRPAAKMLTNLSERIGESPWLSQLNDVSVGHGVSLLWWRSGGFEHPHDTPPYPFMPSPTSAHSSKRSRTHD